MPLEGHWRQTHTPLRKLTRRERLVAIGAAVTVVIALIVLVVATAGDSRPQPGPGCIRPVVAGVMGGSELNACGARAKSICAAHAGQSDPGSQAIQASCREAGIL